MISRKEIFTGAPCGCSHAFKIGNQLEIFAGPTFNYVYFDIASGKGMDLVNHFMWGEQANDEHYHGMYIGAVGGISYKLK